MKRICLLLFAGVIALFIVGCGGGTGSGADGADYVHPTVSAAQNFLREQQAANQRTVALVAKARDAGNLSQALQALETRRREIYSAMERVDSGIRSGYFHKDDRQTLLGPLEQELAWVEASLATLRSVE